MFYGIFTGIAAVINASAANLDKYILSKEKIHWKLYLVASFFLLAIINLPLFLLFGEIQPQAKETIWLIALALSIILSVIVNILYYAALQHEKLSEIQPITLLAPLFTIIGASIFLKDERDTVVIILAVIAALTLAWAHLKKEHIKFHKALVPLLIYVILVAPFSAILHRKLLTIYNPFAFEFILNSVVFLALFLIYRPRWSKLHKKNPKILIITNILWTIGWILVFYSYTWIGVIRTTLIMMLSPLLVYVFARVFLKEKLYWKNVVALVIILICVTIAQIVNGV